MEFFGGPEGGRAVVDEPEGSATQVRYLRSYDSMSASSSSSMGRWK